MVSSSSFPYFALTSGKSSARVLWEEEEDEEEFIRPCIENTMPITIESVLLEYTSTHTEREREPLPLLLVGLLSLTLCRHRLNREIHDPISRYFFIFFIFLFCLKKKIQFQSTATTTYTSSAISTINGLL